MFIDEVKIFAQAGHGGRGCIAFCREAYRPKGGPDGGNGGRGGSVILQADHDLNNLIGQYYVPRLIAEKGQHGLGKGMDGHAGKDLIVKVPCGTLIWKLPDPLEDAVPAEKPASAPVEIRKKAVPQEPVLIATAKRPLLRFAGNAMAEEIDLSADDAEPFQHGPDDAELVADLTVHGQQFVLCKGGRGGLGNRNFATARNQTPRFAQPGEPGGEGYYRFELRMMADVGVVGYPNAGKSTLLTAISRARPKIAAYPFTTLTPQVGIVEYADFKRLTLCDVPGLIEGAHENVGLGHAFLRHITRCKILVILLDMAGTDGREPWSDYRQLLRELQLYDPALLEKPRLVVANKMDEPVAEANLKKFKRRVPRTPVLPIAAAFDEGMPKFKALIREAVEEAVAT
ncbi:MAG: Obg family GTPase [Limisphaerales bacterium]